MPEQMHGDVLSQACQATADLMDAIVSQPDCPECAAFEATNPDEWERIFREWPCKTCWEMHLAKCRRLGEELARRQNAAFFRAFHQLGQATSLEQARVDVREIHPELKVQVPRA